MKYTIEQLETMIGSKIATQNPGLRALWEQRLERLKTQRERNVQRGRELAKRYGFARKAIVPETQGSLVE